MVLAPGGEARGDQLGGGGVDRLLALADFGAEPRLGFGERQPGRRALTKLLTSPSAAALVPRVERDDAVLDAAVGPDQHRQRPARRSGTKLNCLSRSSLLRREDDAGAGRQAGQRRRRGRQRLLDRLVADDLALDPAPLARRRAPRPA